MKIRSVLAALSVLLASAAAADVGDPQVKTDHPWYPGKPAEWTLPTGKGAVTRWVEIETVAGK